MMTFSFYEKDGHIEGKCTSVYGAVVASVGGESVLGVFDELARLVRLNIQLFPHEKAT
jgi:hypothetical protein